jgi:uncharacterized membrane protein
MQEPPVSRAVRPQPSVFTTPVAERLNPVVRAFLRGLLIVAPAAATAWLVWSVFVWVDGLFQFERLGMDFPGLGILCALLLTLGVGFLTRVPVTRYVLEVLEQGFTRTPLVRLVYTSLHDLIDAFVGERKRFDTPVLVAPYGKDGALVPGFVTRRDLGMLGLGDYVSVYLPQSYNFAGQLVLVPLDSLREIQADATDVMAFIVSGGVTVTGANGASTP